jgi:hypothetical protein
MDRQQAGAGGRLQDTIGRSSISSARQFSGDSAASWLALRRRSQMRFMFIVKSAHVGSPTPDTPED